MTTEGGHAERVRKVCGKVRERGEEVRRSTCGPRIGLAGKRKRGAGGWVVSMGPVEEPFGYSKQQRPAGAASASAPYPLPRQSFTLAGGHRFVTMAKLSIHSGYLPGKRPPPRAGSTRLLSSSPFAFPHHETCGRDREKGARKGKSHGGRRDREIRDTRAHIHTHVLLRGLFSSSFVTLYVARERLLSTILVNHPVIASTGTASGYANGGTITPFANE